ncbi:MAG: hypothetical protein AAF438_22060 [Pseudomonadota bacterium]
MQSYAEIENLEFVYLEDSYVLEVLIRSDKIIFEMDLVLCEEHDLYSPPPENEQYCYKLGRITFPNVVEIFESTQTESMNVGTEGAIDLGNIDQFEFEGSKFRLQGDWGSLTLISDPPNLEFH